MFLRIVERGGPNSTTGRLLRRAALLGAGATRSLAIFGANGRAGISLDRSTRRRVDGIPAKIGSGTWVVSDEEASDGKGRSARGERAGVPGPLRYPLPAGAWSYDGKPGSNEGCKYRDKKRLNGPIRSVNVKTAKQVKATGSGGPLGLVLGSDPSPVDVVLSLGGTRYCMSFGGTTSFAPGKFSAKNALAPASCPP